jgi:methylated-DNA-protein-cysteine methyltransferase-like protein
VRERPEEAASMEWLSDRFCEVVERIPRGRIATYGQIARLAGLPGHARHVGRALRELSGGEDLPWHRVVNSEGRISARRDGASEEVQRTRLRCEGVTFDGRGRVSLLRYRWDGGLRVRGARRSRERS